MGGRGIPMLFGAKSLHFASLDPPEQPRRWQPREALRGQLWSGRPGCIATHPLRIANCEFPFYPERKGALGGQPRGAPWGDGRDGKRSSIIGRGAFVAPRFSSRFPLRMPGTDSPQLLQTSAGVDESRARHLRGTRPRGARSQHRRHETLNVRLIREKVRSTYDSSVF